MRQCTRKYQKYPHHGVGVIAGSSHQWVEAKQCKNSKPHTNRWRGEQFPHANERRLKSKLTSEYFAGVFMQFGVYKNER